MMGNFWKSFSQGQQAGQAIVDALNKERLRSQLRDINGMSQTQEYSPEDLERIRQAGSPQASGAPTDAQWDEENQAWRDNSGGLYVPQNAPTFDNGKYTLGDGSQVGVSKYRFGDTVQDKPFTKYDMDAIRNEKVAQVFENMGDIEKAMNYRTQGLQQGMLGQQLNKMREEEGDRAKWKTWQESRGKLFNTWGDTVNKARDLYAQGDIEGAMGMLTSVYNKDVPDGNHVYYDHNSGTAYIGDGKNLTQSQINVHNPETFESIIKAGTDQINNHFMNTMPVTDIAQMLALNKDTREGRALAYQMMSGDRDYGLNVNKFNLDQTRVGNERDYQQGQLRNQSRELSMKEPYYKSETAKNYADAYKSRKLGNSYETSGKNVMYDENGYAYVTSFNSKDGGLTLNPIMKSDGTQFKASTKATGIKGVDPNKLPEKKKIQYQEFVKKVRELDDPDMSPTELIDLAAQFGLTADDVGIPDPYAGIKPPKPGK
jgi:hypothetical protein